MLADACRWSVGGVCMSGVEQAWHLPCKLRRLGVCGSSSSRCVALLAFSRALEVAKLGAFAAHCVVCFNVIRAGFGLLQLLECINVWRVHVCIDCHRFVCRMCRCRLATFRPADARGVREHCGSFGCLVIGATGSGTARQKQLLWRAGSRETRAAAHAWHCQPVPSV
jgi:hypothetical protein